MNKKEKIIHRFLEDNFEVIIEMPETNHEKEYSIINELRSMMNHELLLQINK